jgi:signal transduction histidine kinase
VESGGGTIRVESAEGQGSTFRFSWPKNQPVEGERNEVFADHSSHSA